MIFVLMKEPGCDYETECVFLLIKKDLKSFGVLRQRCNLEMRRCLKIFFKKYLTKQRLYDILYSFG